jgi:hypothetical protein
MTTNVEYNNDIFNKVAFSARSMTGFSDIQPETIYNAIKYYKKDESRTVTYPPLKWIKDGSGFRILGSEVKIKEFKSNNFKSVEDYLKILKSRKQCDEILDIIIEQFNNTETFRQLVTRNDWFKSAKIKIKQIIKDKLLENIISSITPFKHTTNTSCIRAFLKIIGVGQKLPDFGWPIANEIVKSLVGPEKELFISFLQNTGDNVIGVCLPNMIPILKLSVDNMGETLKNTTIYNDLTVHLTAKEGSVGKKKGGKSYRITHKGGRKTHYQHSKQKYKERNTKRKINNRKTMKIMYGGDYFSDEHKKYTEVIGAAWICWLLINIHTILYQNSRYKSNARFEYTPSDYNFKQTSQIAANNVYKICYSTIPALTILLLIKPNPGEFIH